jgi:hypothetical protein
VWAIARWPERREHDRRDQDGRAHAEKNLHRQRIARFAATRWPRAVRHFTSVGTRRIRSGSVCQRMLRGANPGVSTARFAVDRPTGRGLGARSKLL